MGLGAAISATLGGLRVTQQSLNVVSHNIANASTPGYHRRNLVQAEQFAGNTGLGVRVESINRAYNSAVEKQFIVESGTNGYASVIASFQKEAAGIFGTPGAAGSLDTLYNDFTQSIQNMAANPESMAARRGVVSSAEILANQLHSLTDRVQALRLSAEQAIDTAINDVNQLAQQIYSLNQQIVTTRETERASLLDLRDAAIGKISEYADIRVNEDVTGAVTVTLRSGFQLVGSVPSTMVFEPATQILPSSEWRSGGGGGVGTILSGLPPSGSDLISSQSFRSGKIAALIEARDQILVETQASLDDFAAGMSKALGDVNVAGTAVTSGAASGFDLDTTGLQNGNVITMSITNGSVEETISFVRVNSASLLPVDPSKISAPGRIVGINFSGGLAAAATAMQTALGTGFTVTASGSTLRFLDDGATGATDINSLSANKTVTTTASGSTALPLFVDTNPATPYFTGSLESGNQKIGYAARISVNETVINDDRNLIIMSSTTTTNLGDVTRPLAMVDALRNSLQAFSPSSGFGTDDEAFQSDVSSFLQRVIEKRGQESSGADLVAEGQQVVINSLNERLQDSISVDVDTEMANLVQLQQAYQANVRVFQALDKMFEALMQL